MGPDLHSKHPHRYFLFVHHEPQNRRCRVSSSHISSEPLACNVSLDLIFHLATSFYDLEQFIHPANIGTFFQCAKKKMKKVLYSQTTKSRGRDIFFVLSSESNFSRSENFHIFHLPSSIYHQIDSMQNPKMLRLRRKISERSLHFYYKQAC